MQEYLQPLTMLLEEIGDMAARCTDLDVPGALVRA